MTKLAAFNQKCLYYNVGNNFVSVESWKYCFQTWGYKLQNFPEAAPPAPKPISYWPIYSKRIAVASSQVSLCLDSSHMHYRFLNHWSMLNADIFLSLWYDKALILKHFLILSNTNTKVWKVKSKKWVWLIWVFM